MVIVVAGLFSQVRMGPDGFFRALSAGLRAVVIAATSAIMDDVEVHGVTSRIMI